MSEPNYYSKNGLSPLSAFKKGLLSEDEFVGFCKGNVIKYVVRAGSKDDACEDIQKAIDYLNVLSEYYTDENDFYMGLDERVDLLDSLVFKYKGC